MKNKVKMLKSLPGVHDGHLHPVHFAEGQEYDIGPNLLQAFINCGAVELVNEEDEKAEGDETPGADEKSKGDAPSNKVKTAAPTNKSK